MQRLFLLTAAIVLLLAAALPAAASGDAERQSSDVYELSPGPPPIGTIDRAAARATRSADHASITVRTVVEPGAALTAWVVAFDNADDDCSGVPIMVDGDPIPGTVCGANAPTDVFYLDGAVANPNGRVMLRGQIGVHNHATGTVDYLTLTQGDGVLHDVAGSEFHIVVRTHGEALADFMPDQINYFGGGCTPATNPFTGIDGLLPGPNACLNIQAAFFTPLGG